MRSFIYRSNILSTKESYLKESKDGEIEMAKDKQLFLLLKWKASTEYTACM